MFNIININHTIDCNGTITNHSMIQNETYLCNNTLINKTTPTTTPQTYSADMALSSIGKIVLYICFSLMFVIGTIGNAIVIYVIGIKNLAVRSFDIHIISLSIADFISSIFIPLVMIHDLATNLESWQLLGEVGCKIFAPMNHITIMISSLTLVIISASRLRVIQSTRTIRNSRCRSYIEVSLAWIISIAAVVPYINAYRYEQNICFDLWSKDYKKDGLYRFIYHSIYEVISCFLPITVMVIVYSIAIQILRSRTVPGNNETLEAKRKKQNMKIIKMFGTIVIIFFLLTTPFMVEVLVLTYYFAYNVDAYYNDLKLWFHINYILYTISSFNSCVNPFIYATMNRNVRRSFRKHLGSIGSVWLKTSRSGISGGSSINMQSTFRLNRGLTNNTYAP